MMNGFVSPDEFRKQNPDIELKKGGLVDDGGYHPEPAGALSTYHREVLAPGVTRFTRPGFEADEPMPPLDESQV